MKKKNIKFFVLLQVLAITCYFYFHYLLLNKNTQSGLPRLESDSFFVISTIFNPASYSKRYDNYQKFANYMESSGAHLITVEVIFPALNQTDFHVTSPNNPDHIQIVSNSVFWLKENLINIAAMRLPPHAKYICWLDADVFFPLSDEGEEVNWVPVIINSLGKSAVVQVFETLHYLGPNNDEIFRVYKSFGYAIAHKLRNKSGWHTPGFGWAMHLSAFKAMGGIPDCDVVGGGDLHFASCLVPNRLKNPPIPVITSDYTKSAYASLKTWVKAHEKKRILSYAPLTLAHRWHGAKSDRHYAERKQILEESDFNCNANTTKLDNGLRTFRNGTNQRFLERIANYFFTRKEDGNKYAKQDVDKKRLKKS